MAVTHIHHLQPSNYVVIKPFDYCFSNGKLLFGSRIQTYQNPVPILRRRVSVSRLWDALTSGNSAAMAIRRGMLLFRQGDVLGSLMEFDKAIVLDPRQKAYLWQRGLSLYYLDRYEEGARQFRLDVAQNPNDTEESIWCFLCEAQLYGIPEARKRFLEVGRDPRPVMRQTYNMFKDGGDPEKLVAAFLNGQPNEYFYASLYAGLYYESQNEPDAAKVHLVAACKSPYGARSDDYMAALAKVHCKCRNWNVKSLLQEPLKLLSLSNWSAPNAMEQGLTKPAPIEISPKENKNTASWTAVTPLQPS